MKKNPPYVKALLFFSLLTDCSLLVESFESPQTKQFKRWKSYVAE
jgi:hypothetical protein